MTSGAMNRRTFLRGGVLAGVGIAAAALIGCGGSEDSEEEDLAALRAAREAARRDAPTADSHAAPATESHDAPAADGHAAPATDSHGAVVADEHAAPAAGADAGDVPLSVELR